ncbi:MAG TPA: glucokinase [Xanthomonadaceae bacterium]|nr:glucokinase [Xanthomonadaceae bacterium]
MDALPADAVLLADIGGTNARFALADCNARRPLLPDSVRKFAVADFGSLVDTARHYLQATGARPARGVFSVAGPVLGDEVRMTNHPWVIGIGATRDALGLRALDVVNDFAAQAMAVDLLGENDVCVIGPTPWRPPPQPPRDGTRVILGPGTGLGVGALAIRDGRAIAVTTEAGHVGFAPADALQVALLQTLARRFGRVSNERLVSGGGLVNLHAALGEIEGASAADFPVAQPADVTAGAAAGDARCRHTIAVFCAIFGAVAGDMALAFAAWDGVFLSGGVVPHLLNALREPGFRAAFEDKGRYAGTLAAVPTLAVVHPQPGLLGAAAIARAQEPAREGGAA